MNKKLFVGGVSWDTTEASLQQAFEQAGKVDSVVIITDRNTGKSKGFGFVEMGSEEDAQKAMEMWNGKELDGRKLAVNEARPPRENNDRW